MFRRLLFISVGLASLIATWHVHKHAVRMVDRAIGRPLTKDDQLPQGRADLYFGDDPLEVSERPENKAKQKQAIALDQFAHLIGAVSILMILAGLKLRRAKPHPPTEEQPCAPSMP